MFIILDDYYVIIIYSNLLGVIKMAEELAAFFVELFGGLSSFKFGKELIIFICRQMCGIIAVIQ